MTCFLRQFVAVIALTWCANAVALPITIDFESFVDGDVLTNQVPGLTFSNAAVLTAGVSLNELEFPPRSGVNVIFDSGGSIVINFASPVTSILAYLTYISPVTVRIYDAALNEVGSATSLFLNKLALSGDAGSSPNEALSLAFAAGFVRAVFTGSTAGGSFTLDDLTLATAIPEPSTTTLVLALATFFAQRRWMRR